MQRKIYLLATACVLLIATHIKAQDATTEDIRKKVRIGLQFSPEITWLKAQDNTIKSGGTKFGFSFGPMVDFRFGENYAFGTGINIVNAHGELSYLADSTKFNSFPGVNYPKGTVVTYKLRYVEIPLLLRLNTNEIGYMRYFAHFGFLPGINIGAKGNISDAVGANNKVNVDLGKDITFPNISLMVGAGFSYSLTNTTALYVSVSFVNGFIDVTDNPKGYKTKAILNRVPLSVGILF